MKYLLIENKGELDINSLILVGASTKRDDASKIGMFGSGNKYAIATLIKHKIPFKIFSGETEVNLTTKAVSFRGKEFEQIFVDGKETSLTTDMGPQWKPWMAVREFVSNSLDEGQSNIVHEIDTINAREGFTRIYIGVCKDIEEITVNWSKYFSFDREDIVIENPDGKVLFNNNIDDELSLYRKGIRCIESTSMKSIFHYDLPDFCINESRIINSGQGYWEVSRFLCKNATDTAARTILENIGKKKNNGAGSSLYYEYNLYFDTFQLNPNWEKAIGDTVIVVDTLSGFYEKELRKAKFYMVPFSLAKGIARTFPNVTVLGISKGNQDIAFKLSEETPKMKFLLKESVSFLEATEYPVNHAIQVVDFADEETLGISEGNVILLSSNLFDKGKRKIVATIIEVNELILAKLRDNSVESNKHFVNLFLAEKEQRFAHFL